MGGEDGHYYHGPHRRVGVDNDTARRQEIDIHCIRHDYRSALRDSVVATCDE